MDDGPRELYLFPNLFKSLTIKYFSISGHTRIVKTFTKMTKSNFVAIKLINVIHDVYGLQ